MSNQLDGLFGGSLAEQIATTGAPVTVKNSAPPSAGQALVATSPTEAIWQNVAGGSGDSDDTATAIATTTGEVVISGNAPNAGDVLTATSPDLAMWKAPSSLSIDPTIKTGDFLAQLNVTHYVNASGSNITVEFPSTPADGARMKFLGVNPGTARLTVVSNKSIVYSYGIKTPSFPQAFEIQNLELEFVYRSSGVGGGNRWHCTSDSVNARFGMDSGDTVSSRPNALIHTDGNGISQTLAVPDDSVIGRMEGGALGAIPLGAFSGGTPGGDVSGLLSDLSVDRARGFAVTEGTVSIDPTAPSAGHAQALVTLDGANAAWTKIPPMLNISDPPTNAVMILSNPATGEITPSTVSLDDLGSGGTGLGSLPLWPVNLTGDTDVDAGYLYRVSNDCTITVNSGAAVGSRIQFKLENEINVDFHSSSDGFEVSGLFGAGRFMELFGSDSGEGALNWEVSSNDGIPFPPLNYRPITSYIPVDSATVTSRTVGSWESTWVDVTTAAVTLTLPASHSAGDEYYCNLISAAAHTCLVQAASGQSIIGNPGGYTLTIDYEFLGLRSNGTTWVQIS